MEGFGSGRSKKNNKTINKDYLKRDERMKGRPGAVPEECGLIHGGLSELQHNILHTNIVVSSDLK